MVGEFAGLGHHVVGCGRNPGHIAELSAAFPSHSFTALDVADDAAVRAWAETSLRRFGAPHLLINNAALINRNAPLWEVPPQEFSDVIDVNIKGTTNVIRHFVPAMIAARTGVIVNMSSGWGRSVSPEVAPYCATKYAVEGLSHALALELPAGLACVPLHPGVIHTEMLDSCFGDDAAGHILPEPWAAKAVPWLLRLTPRENGKSLTVPL